MALIGIFISTINVFIYLVIFWTMRWTVGHVLRVLQRISRMSITLTVTRTTTTRVTRMARRCDSSLRGNVLFESEKPHLLNNKKVIWVVCVTILQLYYNCNYSEPPSKSTKIHRVRSFGKLSLAIILWIVMNYCLIWG